MKTRVYTDYDPVRILKGVGRSPDNALALKAGLQGAFVEIEEENIPVSREHRSEWMVSGNKVEPDPVKVAAKLEKQAKKEAAKNKVLDKLKITKEELQDLMKE